MRGGAWLVGLIGLAAFSASQIRAESIALDTAGIGFNISNHTLFTNTQNLENADVSPQLLRSETHVRAERGRFNFGVILANRLSVAKADGGDVPIVLEKKFFNYESDHWQWTVGDSHQELGRGIALALFRDDTFGIDYTVEGAALKFTPGDWEARVFGGEVKALAAPVALIPFQSPLLNREIWIASAALKYKGKTTQVGAHYLLSMNRPSGSPFDKRWHTAGATWGAQVGEGWDAYAESNVMVNERLQGSLGALPTAFGSYASVVYSPLPWKFKVEFKDYRDYAYDFRRPPSMEEDIVTSLNFSNVTAARLWAERRLGVYNSVRASLLAGYDRVESANLRHAVASIKWKFGQIAVEGRSGYRWMQGKSDLLHGDVKAKIPTFTGQALELGYRKLHGFNNLNFFTSLDDRNYFDLGYTFSSSWSVTVGAEYLPQNPVSVGQTFLNAGTLVKIDSFTGRAFVGATSGGPQCSGGICRMVPAYSGMMVEGTYAF